LPLTWLLAAAFQNFLRFRNGAVVDRAAVSEIGRQHYQAQVEVIGHVPGTGKDVHAGKHLLVAEDAVHAPA